ncbi:hypothetical protein [Clostridium akagii]|uniref:hypothetical protein n=1 Tax=Clostridium akagii TaxID=91623 RepID=UPI00047C29FB|nr:hypothetical protein [Clostridium akagii]
MKKLIYVLVIVITIVFLVGLEKNSYTENSYRGKYVSQNNVILELDENNNCTIINTIYKDDFYSYGIYAVKDNTIKITMNNNADYYGRTPIEGKVYGSKIEFTDKNVDHTFVKQ